MISTRRINLINDIIKPTPRQRSFMQTVKDNTYILYGGAAGGGRVSTSAGAVGALSDSTRLMDTTR